MDNYTLIQHIITIYHYNLCQMVMCNINIILIHNNLLYKSYKNINLPS